jgi:small nuclear ribonucleoprotein (snRNP)-like protein
VKKSKRGKKMNEMIKRFIGREVVISTMDNIVTGIVEAVDENWVVLKAPEKNGGGSDMVNIDHIQRIRDCPVNKNGKKKTVYS